MGLEVMLRYRHCGASGSEVVGMLVRFFKSAVFVAMLAAIPADAAESEAAKADAARLQGMWSMVEYVVDGTESVPQKIKSWILIVEGDEYNPGIREYSVEFTYRINPTRTPKTIDLIPNTNGARGRVLRGIYSIEGDRFTLCYPSDASAERPAGFAARTGSGLVRVSWQRQKTSTSP
jgi:uncharacterized protein (TIGR03067 family)